ncbi:MAG: MlaA family lipoprotein, partial [Candidatus Puniceispirillaceae bacterium]
MFASPENIARKARLLPLMAMIVVAACSSVPETERTDQRDPYEASNRKAFAFNMAVDTHLLEPAASSYRKLMPMAGRRAIDNHVDWT